MIRIDTQIHGYRQGHQLLSASAKLSRADQSLLDRLSDMAGPLRPGETFNSYLSGYPVPSGDYYVLARTWQDLSVSRAGCVCTFSLLIPSSVWSEAAGVHGFLNLLDLEFVPAAAEQVETDVSSSAPLEVPSRFRAHELLEALFLEEGKPIAIFDVSEAEVVTARLLTAFWPALRARFSVSTLALSPRKIGGRNFDLVFAPRDARPKFADWPGRRVDGQSDKGARHRWTDTIVDRVFVNPFPRLLDRKDGELLGSRNAGDAKGLRVALMWDDLLEKVEHSPSAALGLLDVASSGLLESSEVFGTLEPVLARATERAIAKLSTSDAWEFIGAMVTKVRRTPMTTGVRSLASAAGVLAGKDPVGAIELVEREDSTGEVDALIPWIAAGISEQFGEPAEQALLDSHPETLARLVCAARPFAESVADTPSLAERLGEVLHILPPKQFTDVRQAILPLLIQDAHSAAAIPLLNSLDVDGLLVEVQHLADSNSFGATTFFVPLVARAREIGAIGVLRKKLLAIPVSKKRDQFLRSTLTPAMDDIVWLLEGANLDAGTTEHFLADVLRMADADQFGVILSDDAIATTILKELPLEASDVLRRAVLEFELSLPALVSTTLRLLPVIDSSESNRLAVKALERCLTNEFGGDESSTISMLLGIVGKELDGRRVIRSGVERGVSASIANRNLVAFEKAPQGARDRILNCIDDLARTLELRYTVELDADAAEACAQLLLDANAINSEAVVRASGRVLPMLFRAQDKPVSNMIAATFPIIYLELVRQDKGANLLEQMLFLEWDQRKVARRRLVRAFLSSAVWTPSDLALTACRCSDVEKILRRTMKSFGGRDYLDKIGEDLLSLPESCKEHITQAIVDIRSELSDKYY